MATNPNTTRSWRFIDLTGKKFGRWVVLDIAEKVGDVQLWRCRCECGTEKKVHGGNLRKGLTSSCGCFRKEHLSHTRTVHGASGYKGKNRGPLYVLWTSMRKRCNTETDSLYSYYGARGIRICDRWSTGDGDMSGYECFVADMGPRPSPKHSIDRIDVDGDYSSENCRWATQREQTRNTRANRWVEYNGQRMTVSDAVEAAGINMWNFYERLEIGWSEHKALHTPLRKRNWNGPKKRASKA